MGGQSLPRDGVALTLNARAAPIAVDKHSNSYTVSAGARWSEVIAALDPHGLSPAVMQSNNDFGVAGTLSVNAHGWPAPYGPFGTTVRSFRIMLATGDVATCSRTENPELFALAIGGYGLFGVILDVELSLAENVLLRPSFEVLPAAKFAPRMAEAVDQDSSIRMAYGRLSVHSDGFLREALLGTYRSAPGAAPPVSSGGVMLALSREIFRAQIGSDVAKRTRWYAETQIGPRAATAPVSRNRLLNEPVARLAGRDRRRTDILHEYFLPIGRLEDFLVVAREVIPASSQELLNVTLRFLEEDRTSALAYARGRRIAAVMLFSQEMTKPQEIDMRALTQRLIDAALECGGSFYLPYRLHARRDQIDRAYPQLGDFLAAKRRYDSGLLFRNLMWDRYFA